MIAAQKTKLLMLRADSKAFSRLLAQPEMLHQFSDATDGLARVIAPPGFGGQCLSHGIVCLRPLLWKKLCNSSIGKISVNKIGDLF